MRVLRWRVPPLRPDDLLVVSVARANVLRQVRAHSLTDALRVALLARVVYGPTWIERRDSPAVIDA